MACKATDGVDGCIQSLVVLTQRLLRFPSPIDLYVGTVQLPYQTQVRSQNLERARLGASMQIPLSSFGVP